MRTNISNIIDALIALIERNRQKIDLVIAEYEPDRQLNVFKGMRKTLPRSAYPSFEIEPVDGSTSWNTVETQKPEYSVECILTTTTDNQDMSVEYHGTVTRILLEIMNSPQNMLLKIPNEQNYLPNSGYCETRISNAIVSSVSYNATKDGTFRVARWTWTCDIMEGKLPSAMNNAMNEVVTEILQHPLPPPPEQSE